MLLQQSLRRNRWVDSSVFLFPSVLHMGKMASNQGFMKHSGIAVIIKIRFPSLVLSMI